MDFQEYQDLPDGMSADDVARVLEIFIAESADDAAAERILKLEVLCDRQWHTYELPNRTVREKVASWIAANWQEENEYYELVLGLCYCFGLGKEIFLRALNAYKGEQKWEYVQMLENSAGNEIDPYWSMR